MTRTTEEFTEDVAAWFAANTPADWVSASHDMTPAEYLQFEKRWVRTLGQRGFAAPSADPRWGGGGYSPREQSIIYDEWARAGAPSVDTFVVSMHHIPVTFAMLGTPEQQQRYIPAAIGGTVWCQGFSEPGSGSDLASLRTRAVHEGGEWVVTGQKIWSSMAEIAEHTILLARTGTAETGTRGLTYFVLDMDQPGVEVRRIKQNPGHAEFCEIFLDDARIPECNVIGEVDDGWRAAQATLAAERGPVGFDIIARLYFGLQSLGRRLADVPGQPLRTRSELADLIARATIVRGLALDTIDLLERGADSGGLASLLKLVFSELLQDATSWATVRLGAQSLIDPCQPHNRGYFSGDWAIDWLSSWGWTISAGTNEVQRNIIAEHLLGMPREPRPAPASAGGPR